MATKKKLLQAAAGSAGGAGALNVEDVFSTYLYEGNGDKQFIDNGINLGQANDGYSAYFGGSGYYVGAEQTTLTDFTVEGWIYFDNLGSNRSFFTLGYSDLQLYYRSASSNVAIYDGSAKTYSFTPSASTWYHFALVRNGTSVELFIDGVSKGTQTSSATISGDLIIGGYAGSTDPMNGYISNIRVSDNVRYSSNFTAPTSALTTDANTTLLTLQDSTFIDNSGNGNVITPSGGAEMVSHAPFTAAEAGEGGLVWIKDRLTTRDHMLNDTERGADKSLSTNRTGTAFLNYGAVTSFNSNGFSIGAESAVNASGTDLTSWTFRKAPKFFDVVTYTGTGSAQSISHNLGSVPGMIVVKRTDNTSDWNVYHRESHNFPANNFLRMNLTNAIDADFDIWNATVPTDAVFSVGSSTKTNVSGATYVAYLFAHNDGDGGFGPDGDADIIKCGSWTTAGTGSPEVNLGFEPQWIMFKRTDGTGDWRIYDTMRGWLGSDQASNAQWLKPNTSDAESTLSNSLYVTPTGFVSTGIGSGTDYIYIAIRRGPMGIPESATEVFDVVTRTGDATVRSTVPVDISVVDSVLNLTRSGGEAQCLGSRIAGNTYMFTNTTQAELTPPRIYWDYSDSFAWDDTNGNLSGSTYVDYAFKRAPNFFDVVAYDGNGSTQTINHNLGVVPEMIVTKKRTGGTASWAVVLSALNSGLGYLKLDSTDQLAATTYNVHPNRGATTYDCNADGLTNASGSTYIAYLFASLDGVSKVGSYTGNGSTQNIDCGFSSGARFVLIKGSTVAINWYVFDTERGIVSGNDAELYLDTTNAEATNRDLIDPYSSGFSLTGNGVTNVSGETYIFYAIA
jgi:hypothetical protein